VITAILVPNWWQAGLVIIALVLFIVVRKAIRSARQKGAQTEELLGEWEIYQRRRGP